MPENYRYREDSQGPSNFFLPTTLTETIFLWSFTALPIFVKTPASIEVSVSDHQVILSCLATGNPTPDILWWKDGKPLRQDRWHIVSKEGTLKIIDPKIDDKGNYECVAQNSAGEVVSKAVLNYYGVKGWL